MFTLKKIQSTLPEFQTLCNYIIEAMNSFIVGTPQNGRLITGIVLTSGQANLINHKLGRTPIGFIVTKYNANITSPVWQNSITDIQIDLRTATSGTFDVWVF